MERAAYREDFKGFGRRYAAQIFEAISAKGMVCGELVALRGVTPATVSHHLKILADAGLIECAAKGNSFTTARFLRPIAEYSRALAHLATGKKSPEHAS